MHVVHLTRAMRHPFRFFEEPEHAQWIWDHLRGAFPEALASVVMLDHPHVETPCLDVDGAYQTFHRILGHSQRRVGVGDLWLRSGEQQVVEPKKIDRVARYIELNPCRAGLVRSPFEWDFSSLRDRVGATADPWIQPGTLRKLVQRGRFRRHDIRLSRWLDYVNQDERVTDRTPVGTPPESHQVPQQGIPDLARAAAAALRRPADDVQRRGPVRALFLALALDQGLTNLNLLARVAATSRTSLFRIRQRGVPPHWLQAARQCLADPRLSLQRGQLPPVPPAMTA